MNSGKRSLLWTALVASGAVVTAFGLAVRDWASPSPHGYIETLVAGSIVLLGVFLAAGGLIVSGDRLLKILGYLLGSFAVVLLVQFAALLL